MKTILLSITVLVTLSSCNFVTRKFGGTTYIELEPNEKLVNVTWKESNLWALVRDTTKPKTYKFKEYSNIGVLEGEVIITEK